MNLHEYAKKQMDETERDIAQNIRTGMRCLKVSGVIIAFGAGLAVSGMLTSNVDAITAAALVLAAALVPLMLGIRQATRAEDNQIWLDYYREVYQSEEENGLCRIRDKSKNDGVL